MGLLDTFTKIKHGVGLSRSCYWALWDSLKKSWRVWSGSNKEDQRIIEFAHPVAGVASSIAPVGPTGNSRRHK